MSLLQKLVTTNQHFRLLVETTLASEWICITAWRTLGLSVELMRKPYDDCMVFCTDQSKLPCFVRASDKPFLINRNTEHPHVVCEIILHGHPAKTQIRLRIRAVWSGSSLSAWRRFGSFTTHSLLRRISDCADAHADLSLCWARSQSGGEFYTPVHMLCILSHWSSTHTSTWESVTDMCTQQRF